jgi:hypothetical protein
MLKIYIIDADNCLSVEADLTLDPNVQTAEGTFTTQEDLATMTKDWAASRLVEVWNSFAGAPPFADLKEVKRFTDRKSAVARIWNAAERLGAQVEKEEAAIASKPAPAAKPKKAGSKPTAAKGAPAKAKATKGAKLRDTPAGIREGSKTAQVVAMLQRKNGTTLAEIMDKMGWQRHTVRGFVAGAMKKAGYTVESFKPEGGERTYRINA